MKVKLYLLIGFISGAIFSYLITKRRYKRKIKEDIELIQSAHSDLDDAYEKIDDLEYELYSITKENKDEEI